MKISAVLFIMILPIIGCLVCTTTRVSGVACGTCLTPAIVVKMVDSTGDVISGFTVHAINNLGDTVSVTDSTSDLWHVDSTYGLYGRSGVYNLEITHPDYMVISLSNVTVTSGKCGVNPRLLKLIPETKQLAKTMETSYTVLIDSNGVGCGNE